MPGIDDIFDGFQQCHGKGLTFAVCSLEALMFNYLKTRHCVNTVLTCKQLLTKLKHC